MGFWKRGSGFCDKAEGCPAGGKGAAVPVADYCINRTRRNAAPLTSGALEANCWLKGEPGRSVSAGFGFRRAPSRVFSGVDSDGIPSLQHPVLGRSGAHPLRLRSAKRRWGDSPCRERRAGCCFALQVAGSASIIDEWDGTPLYDKKKAYAGGWYKMPVRGGI